MSKWITPVGWKVFTAFVLLTGAVWTVLSASPGKLSGTSGVASPREGFFAPDFSLKTLQGETIALSELRGRPVLINFWASWCTPCKAEMPAIQEQYQEKEADGFIVLAVASLPQDNLNDISAFVDAHLLSFPILIDEDNQVFQTYRVRSLPTSFFVRPDGVIQEVVVGGPMAEALLRVRIDQLFEKVAD